MEKRFCGCGCGVEVKGNWVRGHHSRVNNISKRADVKEKRRKMFERLHDEGKLGNPWNKGLTALTDERLEKAGKNWKKNLSEDMREEMSLRMKREWKEGFLIPLKGPDHANWKGGVSSIVQRLRGSALYKLWKRPILKRDNFLCTLCGSGENLNVHHDKERFADIIQKFLPADHHQLTWNEETRVIDEIVRYHVENKVSGMTLCEDCHDGVHKTVKQLKEALV